MELGTGSPIGSCSQAPLPTGASANITEEMPVCDEAMALTRLAKPASLRAWMLTVGLTRFQSAGVVMVAGSEYALWLPTRSVAVTTYVTAADPGRKASVKLAVVRPLAAST
jgi:hypothetical protein